MKRVLITGGPTNEYIDEVMKITNMSTGKIAVQLAALFARGGYNVTLCLTKGIKPEMFERSFSQLDNITVLPFETTEQLMDTLKSAAAMYEYDIVIQSAAVADYKPEFSFRAEDMAMEISTWIEKEAHAIAESYCRQDIYNAIFNMLTNPDCKVNDQTKISSVEPNLTVKLGLTPKIIGHLREWFPNAYICGFKLLENVSKEELIEAATKQVKKCQTNLCFANDLADLRKGESTRYVVTASGYHDIRVEGADGIYNLLNIVTQTK